MIRLSDLNRYVELQFHYPVDVEFPSEALNPELFFEHCHLQTAYILRLGVGIAALVSSDDPFGRCDSLISRLTAPPFPVPLQEGVLIFVKVAVTKKVTSFFDVKVHKLRRLV